MAIIEMKSVTRQYKNGQIRVEVLKGIDLSIERSEFVSIMGPSGSFLRKL